MEIRTTEYQFVHGRKPRGAGAWAFNFQYRDLCAPVIANLMLFGGTSAYGGGGCQSESEKARREITLFAPRMLTYSEASRWAQKVARENGFTGIEVGT